MTSASATRPSPRERLLDAAGRLFYQEGVGIGVEALCKAAGVSKRSMYQLFATKDELLAAALERQGPGLRAVLRPPDTSATPRARVLYVFERLEEHASAPDFLGCPYLAVQVELKRTDHPASLVASDRKQALCDFFRGEAERGGAADPALLARQLMLVYDGASARAGIKADALTDRLAVTTAATLMDAAGIPA
ncbi:TetR family transcriptional regulator [Streptomyces sulfonofaciens]|uniref:TetR family transcriptional regulator n=1 Tax=Streptomyces sulfonofaciens TaxID=68272 RepID=A0A919FV67_9ACTN|nr:TetR/AcrR family transcriptional regulator [Streptomyces sulfonofaciens]GHH72633.1 TetR family transcriptional regulator [Streptomyces sulfonofaciens]